MAQDRFGVRASMMRMFTKNRNRTNAPDAPVATDIRQHTGTFLFKMSKKNSKKVQNNFKKKFNKKNPTKKLQQFYKGFKENEKFRKKIEKIFHKF